MRSSVHDTVVRFRANGRLVADAETKALREGMSLSELLRHALRQELRTPSLPKIHGKAGSIAAERLHAIREAAGGSREALMSLAQRSLDYMLERPGVAPQCIAEAATYARLAVMHGNNEDMKRLAGILLIQAQLEIDQSAIAEQVEDTDDASRFAIDCNESMAEALYWLDVAADGGDESATDIIQLMADMGVPAEAFQLAKFVSTPVKEPAGV
jgi:predicted nucleic acid-binding protein